MAQDGTLTVAADQAVGKLTVKATAVKDIASSDDTDANKVVGTFEVNVIAEKSFQVVAATVENGKVAFKVGDTENATSFKESETLEIVPTCLLYTSNRRFLGCCWRCSDKRRACNRR